MSIEKVIELIEADYDTYLEARDLAFKNHDIIAAKMFEAKLNALARLWHAIQKERG